MSPFNKLVLVVAISSFYAVTCYKIPHAIESLLSAVEVEEIKKDRFRLRSPEYFAAAKRFTSLLKPVHASLVHVAKTPQCLSTNNSPEWLSYDNKASFSVTPSEYCCQTFAEQACADPRMSFESSTAVISDRINGLGGSANSFLYGTCMTNNCNSRCSKAEGTDASCKSCSNVCQRSCLANLQVVCLKRVCGQNLVSVAEKAMSHNPKGRNFLLHEHTEESVRQVLRIGKKDLRDIESSEVIEFVLSSLDNHASVPLCADSKLVSADRTAGVFLNNAGGTYAESLLKCTANILKPDKLERVLDNPSILTESGECTVAASSSRDHVRLATDRSLAQVDVFNKRRAELNM